MLVGRSLLVLGLFFGYFFSEEVLSQECAQATIFQEEKAEQGTASLRAFTAPSKESAEKAANLVVLIFAFVGIGFVFMLLLLFYFYEPSFLTMSQKQTEVGERPEGFVPYRKSSRSEGEDL